MADQILSCRVCGTDFRLPVGVAIRACPACGTSHSCPGAEGMIPDGLRRAHQQRAACDFVNAERSYRRVLEDHPDNAEALWGLTLCKFGVEYVEDEHTHERRPVVHFLRRTPITEDADYRLACQQAGEPERSQYEADGAYIRQIQQRVMQAQGSQKPWDVFLCYKASLPGSAEPSAKTAEFAYARELYFRLSMEGYRVFFAHETLSNQAGANYEAQIFYALQSARVMLVVCANPAHLNTPWVHSEWARYLERVDAEAGACRLVPLLYDGCNPYALPEAFTTRSIQGLRMGEYASADSLRGVLSSMIRREAPVPENASTVDAQRMLLRISMALEDGEWKKAESLATDMVDRDPECSEAHLSLLLARRHLTGRDKLADCPAVFEGDPAWQRALRFASQEEKRQLVDIAREHSQRMGGIAQREKAAREKAEQERLAWEQAQRERQARERAEQERLAWEQAQRERQAREQAERAAREASSRNGAGGGIVVFARAKERLFGALPLLVYMDGVPNPVGAIAPGQETPIRCPHPCCLTVRSNDGAEVWSCDVRGGLVLRVEVSWPMMGRPRFVVR